MQIVFQVHVAIWKHSRLPNQRFSPYLSVFCIVKYYLFSLESAQCRLKNVVKLMYLDMLGYQTYFGQMEVLKLLTMPGFPGTSSISPTLPMPL